VGRKPWRYLDWRKVVFSIDAEALNDSSKQVLEEFEADVGQVTRQCQAHRCSVDGGREGVSKLPGIAEMWMVINETYEFRANDADEVAVGWLRA
jgi:hypothetical protein